MSTTTHTPGPWRVAERIKDDLDVDDCEALVEGFEVIATICKVNYGDAQANARLIAAAPETAAERDRLQAENAALVAALREITDAATVRLGEPTWLPLIHARAALAAHDAMGLPIPTGG